MSDFLKFLNAGDPQLNGGGASGSWQDVNPVDSGNIVNSNGIIQQPQAPTIPLSAQINNSIGLVNPLEGFLNIISTYPASIPLKSFWYMTFKIPTLISESALTSIDQSFVNNDLAKGILSRDTYMKKVGCVFCRSFNFVGESNSGDAPDLDTRSFRTNPYAGGRSNNFLQSLDVSFYESTISFIDHIIRPWTILMSHYSTLARDNSTSEGSLVADLKQDLTFFLLTRTGVGETDEEKKKLAALNSSSGSAIPNITRPFAVRKKITFEKCFPKTFSNLDYIQIDGNSLETVSTSFSYSNYVMEFGLPAGNLVNNIF